MQFRTIAKLISPALAALALTAGAYRGDRVSINFPDDWSAPEADADGIVTSRQGENGANCNVETKELAGLAGMTMAEINAQYAHVFDLAEWADFLGMKPADITLIKSDLRPLGDAHFLIATMKIKVDDDTDAITRYGFYVLPGRVVMAGCYVEASLYPIYTTLFETTVSSLRPW